MAGFRKGRGKPEGLDGVLRARRAEPPPELVDRLDERIRATARRSRTGRTRIALGIAVSALALAAIGSAGAVSSASSSAQHFADIVMKAVGPSHGGSNLPAANRGPVHGATPDGATPDTHPAPPSEAQPAHEPVEEVHHNPAHHQYLITICHLTHGGIYVELTIPIDQLDRFAGPHDIIPAPPEGCPRPHHHR
jgi:hypothetical protein